MSCSCGCCTGVRHQTPAELASPPGLDALPYRAGTHASFNASMLAQLPAHRPLDRLTTRETDDPAIAFLDAWASVAHVLTFYQERIANEGYLRTATERRSLLELARLVGYVPRPGVAAGVYPAFTLDAGYRGDVPAGTRVQSLPGPGERPQSFETAETISARAEWNAIRPRLLRARRLAPDTLTLYVDGTATGLRPNALLLLFGGDRPVLLGPVARVEAQPEDQRTLVTLLAPEPGIAPLRALRNRLSRLLDLRRHDLIGGVLATTLRERLAPVLALPTPAEALVAVRRELPGLRDEREHAAAFPRLGPWTADIVAALEDAERALAQDLGAGAPAVAGPAAALDGGHGGIGDVIDVIGELELPPSVPPPSARELSRSVEQLLSPNSGIVPRVLAELRPAVRDTLYHAWAQTGTQTTRPEVHALRLLALPFGAIAPRRPVFDARGAVTGDQEWPLAGTVTLTAACVSDTEIVVGAGDGAEERTHRVELEQLGGAPVRLDDIQTTVEATEEVATIHFERYDRKVRIGPPHEGPMPVDVDGVGRTVALGETVRFTAGPARVTAAHLPGGDEDAPSVITVTLEQCEPLSDDRRSVLALDARYEEILPHSWVAIVRADRDEPLVREVVAVRTVSAAAYGLTATVTELTLDQPWLEPGDCSLAVLRGTVVHAVDEPLTLQAEPVEDDVEGARIELSGLYDGLEPGRWLIVTGERADLAGVDAAELVMLARAEHGYDPAVPGDRTHTTLVLSAPLAYRYRRPSVIIRGNVARATHGETREEVLGSGDASQSAQRFALHQFPLTHVPAGTASGTESTLGVRVDGVLWHESPRFATLGPRDRAYLTLTDDEDHTTVVFGTGRHGARLPTGTENVAAVYRTGIGRAGNVRAGQISLLGSRPLGVTGVVNPLPATGGADRDSRDQIRRNAPLALTALDRIVSTRDYEDFARTFAGIGKALAVRESDGAREVVHLTVAGVDDAPIAADSELLIALRRALRAQGDPLRPVLVEPRELILIVIEARVQIDADHRWDLLEPQLRAALTSTFAFDRRELGQDVLLSEAIAALQRVDGVVYSDIEVFDAVPASAPQVAAEIGTHRRRLERIAVYPPYLQTPPAQPALPFRPARHPRAAQLALLSSTITDTLILRRLPE